MGIFTGLLTLPLAPVRGTVWLAEIIAEEAEHQLAAANSPERALADLEAAHLAGELTDAEFAERQADLIDQTLAPPAEEAP